MCIKRVYTQEKVEENRKKSCAKPQEEEKFVQPETYFSFDAQNAYTLKLKTFLTIWMDDDYLKNLQFLFFFISIRYHVFTFLFKKLNLHNNNNNKHIRW